MAFLNPHRILSFLDLKEHYTAADFGSGSGGWVIPLAKRLKRGKVYAVDILEEPLSALKSRMKAEKVQNVETVKSNLEKTSKLLANSCDLVLITNLLFEVDDKKKVMAEAQKVLKEGGILLIVDWEQGSPLSPKSLVGADEVKKQAEELGFVLEKEFEAGAYHWGLIMKK